jgi:DNA-binding PadR family transcriptional regulator
MTCAHAFPTEHGNRYAHVSKGNSVSESTRYTVLGLVVRRPTYGYALAELLSQWPLPEGHAPPARSIYKALRSLNDEHLIEQQASALDNEPDGPSRQRYGATPEGERRFEEWLARPSQTFSELCLRIGAARRTDVPVLIDIVQQAERQLLARHRDLRTPEVETLIAKGASWESVVAALLAKIEYSEIAARSAVLRDLRRALEDVRDHGPHEVPPA